MEDRHRPPPVLQSEEMSTKKNPCVFLDLSFDAGPAERIVIELFADVLPKTAENFRAFCTGETENGEACHYKGTIFDHIYKGVFAEGGVFSNTTVTGCESIYGQQLYADVNFETSVLKCGMLTVHECLNGSKFYIILDSLPFLVWDDHAVFGMVVDGMEIVKKIDKLGTLPEGKPCGQVKITNCGDFPEEDQNKYMMESDKGKKGNTQKRADASSDGPAKKKQRRSTVGDKRSVVSRDSESYASLVVQIACEWKLAEKEKGNVFYVGDKKSNVMESD